MTFPGLRSSPDERRNLNKRGGFVNWLTSDLIDAFGHTPIIRARARVTVRGRQEVCRVNVAASSAPTWASTRAVDQLFLVGMNSTTRVLRAAGAESYGAEGWSAR